MASRTQIVSKFLHTDCEIPDVESLREFQTINIQNNDNQKCTLNKYIYTDGITREDGTI